MAAAKNIVYVPILNTNDTHYRYKMPKLIAKVEGSGNGIKTVIPNMADIAKSLHRPPSYPIKYFGYEVGAQVRCDKPPFTVNGAHDAEELQKMLYSFIEKFVLCSKCKNPETKLKVKSKTIHQTCFACGHKATIPDTIKFTKYIINHPPEEDPSYSSSSSSAKAATGQKTKEKSSKKKSGTHSPTSGDDKKSEDDEFDDIDEDELVKIVNGLHSIQVQPSADDKKESLNTFNKMILDRKERLNDSSVQKELLSEAIKLGIREAATLALAETLFTDNICEEIKTYRSLLILFCGGNKEAQKYLLGGFEKLVDGVHKDKLINKVQNIVYTFYDCDIIEENTFLEWHENASDRYVSKNLVKLIHEKAEPFIKWLKEAPESDDDDDADGGNNAQQKDNNNKSTNNQVKTNNNNNIKKGEDDDDDDDDGFEIEYSHRVSGLVVEQTKNNNAAQNDDGEEIDIDGI